MIFYVSMWLSGEKAKKYKHTGMKKIPLPVIIVAILFIIVGLSGFLYHLKDFFEPGTNSTEIILVQLLRLMAIVSGILLLRANNAGRWLAIAWLLAHVAISALNSVGETIAHIVLLVIVAVLLFLPVSSAYFRRKSEL